MILTVKIGSFKSYYCFDSGRENFKYSKKFMYSYQPPLKLKDIYEIIKMVLNIKGLLRSFIVWLILNYCVWECRYLFLTYTYCTEDIAHVEIKSSNNSKTSKGRNWSFKQSPIKSENWSTNGQDIITQSQLCSFLYKTAPTSNPLERLLSRGH